MTFLTEFKTLSSTFCVSEFPGMLLLVLLGLYGSVGRITALHTTHFYNLSRDYLHISSENYPQPYLGGETYTWQWSANSGYWGILFLDFDLACENNGDSLVLTDLDRNKPYWYTCRSIKPLDLTLGSSFSIKLNAVRTEESSARGFDCHVFYGRNKDEVKSKINAMKATKRGLQVAQKDDSPTLSKTEIALIIIILVLIFAVSSVVCAIIWRRLHQQTNRTSVHVNIAGIRRESSVSYSRNGNGPPGGGRPRMDSEDSFSPDMAVSKPKRPVKRNESNTSWAMRAERAAVDRNGSSSSSEGDQGNVYSPMPTDSGSNSCNVFQTKPFVISETLDCCLVDKQFWLARTVPISEACGLNSISEESCVKLNSGFSSSQQKGEPSMAVANSGYMLMTNLAANQYLNYGAE